MTPGDLLATIEDYGIQLFIEDGFFRYDAPAGAFNSRVRQEVRAHRQVLLTDWLCPECLHITRVFFGFLPAVRCRRCCDGS
jgi:hypothetical protein